VAPTSPTRRQTSRCPTASSWVAVDYETEGVYLAAQPNGAAGLAGLWLLDPATGTVKAIDSMHGWQYISGGGAWGTADALTGHGPGPGSRLMRMDLKTGAIVSWYKRTDIEFFVAGADASGHPILTVWKVSNAAAPRHHRGQFRDDPSHGGRVRGSLGEQLHSPGRRQPWHLVWRLRRQRLPIHAGDRHQDADPGRLRRCHRRGRLPLALLGERCLGQDRALLSLHERNPDE